MKNPNASFARVFACRSILLAVVVLSGLGCAADPGMIPIKVPPPPLLTVQPPVKNPQPRILYVDQTLSTSPCPGYSARDRLCSGGASMAFKSIGEAGLAAMAGDAIEIRAGSYHEQISPARSGVEGAEITYRNFNGEAVTISQVDHPAIFLQNKSHIVIQGISVNDALGWGRLENAHNNTITSNRFRNALARGTTGGLKLVRSHYNRIMGNSFDAGNDSVVIQESDHNLIADNKFRFARHSLLSVRCGNFNVIRGNEFHNERQKAMEIYDCEGVSDAPFKLDATKRNVIEDNRFIFTRGPSRPHKYNAIQFSGQYGIVRRNIFQDNQGGGLHFQIYKNEALYSYGNRAYQNTFYKNRCYALAGSQQWGEVFGDNLVVNNLFFRNEDCTGRPEQIAVANPSAVILRENAILKPKDDFPFASESDGDLRLKPNSPLIDAGAFLTRTVGAGSGTAVPVADVRFFSDGFGIRGMRGDLIQLEEGGERARVERIDYGRGMLFLDTALNWKDGQGVALAFEGKAPDMGAVESGSRFEGKGSRWEVQGAR